MKLKKDYFPSIPTDVVIDVEGLTNFEAHMPTVYDGFYHGEIVSQGITIYEKDCYTKGLPEIKRVIFSGPVTTVIWTDGTKTHVRCENEDFDKEKGLAMCIAKKALGNKGKYYDVFKKWLKPEYDSSHIEELKCSFTQCKWYKNPDYSRCNECKKKHKEVLTKKR